MARASLWNNENQKQYQAHRERATQDAADRRQGTHTAAALDDIWAALREDERAFMEYLILSERRTAIARREDDLLFRLIDKELLQLPVGVSRVVMHMVTTAYSIPEDVWQRLGDERERFCNAAEGTTDERLHELEERFRDRIEALIV